MALGNEYYGLEPHKLVICSHLEIINVNYDIAIQLASCTQLSLCVVIVCCMFTRDQTIFSVPCISHKIKILFYIPYVKDYKARGSIRPGQ
jgi:hypothetical protein